MEALKKVFEVKRATVCSHLLLLDVLVSWVPQNEPAFVTFVTAGYPTKDDTVPLLLAMQAGGADIIELGVPFSDPIADGPVIQASNTVRQTLWPTHDLLNPLCCRLPSPTVSNTQQF